MMKKMMHFMFLSCYRATGLIEKRFHFGLSFMEKMQLKMHLMMCDACSNYEDQSAHINKALDAMHKKDEVALDDLSKLKNDILSEISKI